MRELPTEILSQIFIRLHQRQKVELMCVCRRWRSIIERYILYDTIVIQSREQFRKWIETFRKNCPNQSTQVQCLVLEIDLGTDLDPALFSSLFPHVRVVYLGRKMRVDKNQLFYFAGNNRIEHIYESCRGSNNDDSNVLTVDSSLYSTTNSNSDSSSQHLSSNSENEEDEDMGEDSMDDSDGEHSRSSSRHHRFRRKHFGEKRNITSQLLVSTSCPHLKSLTVSIYPISGKEFIHLLTGAPNLTSLTLNEFTITIERLELLHRTLPLLRHFCILEGTVASIDKPLPDKIKPAHLISRFFLKIYRGKIQTKTQLLQYIRLKYNNLESFSFHNVFNQENHISLSQGEGGYCFFTDGLLPLLSHFGPQLKKLSIRLPLLDPTDMMILKNCPYQLEHLGLETSHATDIIKECIPALKPLSFLQSLCLHDLECDDNFGFLQHLKYLRKLQIHRPSPDQFNINDLLDMCSDQLETLFLGDCWLISDMINSTRLCYSLKELVLSKVIISKDIDTTMSLFLPELKTLIFNDCLFQDFDFCLPGHHLLNLTVTDRNFCTATHDYILVKTIDQYDYRKVFATLNPLRRQRFFHKQGPAFSCYSSYAHKDIDGYFLSLGPRVIFTLASVKNVSVSTPRTEDITKTYVPSVYDR